MDRAQKIALLKALESGETSVADLKKKQLKMIVNANPPGTAMYYINDKEISEEAYMNELERQKHENGFYVEIGIIAEGSTEMRWL